MSESSNFDKERRESFRLDMEKELIDVKWTDSSGRSQLKKVACRDFSKGGLRIDCDVEIEQGTRVEIIIQATSRKPQLLNARVIRCKQLENGWFEVAFLLDF